MAASRCGVCLEVNGTSSFSYSVCKHTFCLTCLARWRLRPSPVWRRRWANEDTAAFYVSCGREHGDADAHSPIRVIRQVFDDEPWPRDVTMECCPRLAGPPSFQQLPTRVAPYVTSREAFECYRCERARPVAALRANVPAEQLHCPRHGRRCGSS